MALLFDFHSDVTCPGVLIFVIAQRLQYFAAERPTRPFTHRLAWLQLDWGTVNEASPSTLMPT